MTRVVTRTGIVIGGAWQPPPPKMSDDAEYLQAVLLSGMPGAVDPGRCPSTFRQRLIAWIDRHVVDVRLFDEIQ